MKRAVNMDDMIQNYRELLTEQEENELFDEWERTKSNDTLMEIVQAYSPIITRCIREVASYKANRDDLRSEGVVALIEAVKRFDRTRGRFATYAKRCVKGIMLGYVIKNYFVVNVCTSHSKKKLFYAIRKMVAISLTKTGKFDMTRDIALEMSKEYGVEENIIYGIYDMIRRPNISLSDKIDNTDDENGHTIEDHIASQDQDADVVAELLDSEFHRSLINDAMDKVLDYRERRIFTSQVLANKQDRTILENLGEEFDISKERVRQLRNSAYDKVKTEILETISDPGDLF